VNRAEMVDVSSKILALLSVILYHMGYIDTGTLASLVSGLAAIMATLMLHRYKHRVGMAIRTAAKPRLVMLKTLKGEAIAIQPSCKICNSPERMVIEEMIREGRQLSNIHGITPEEITEHIRHTNLSEEELASKYKIKKIDLQEEMFRILERLNQLYLKLEDMDRRYIEGKLSPSAYIDSIGERRQILNKMKENLLIMKSLGAEIKTTQQLSDLLKRLQAR